MKIRSLILTSILLVLSHVIIAQTTSFSTLHHQYLNHAAVCDSISLTVSPGGYDTTVNSDININFTGTNLLNKTYTATITWGNNVTTTHTGTSTLNNTAIVWTPLLTNAVSSTDWDTLNIMIVENASSDSIMKDIIYMSNACHEIYFTGDIDCDGDGTIDSAAYLGLPYIYNATDTIHALLQTNDSLFYFPDNLTGTYSVGYTGGYYTTSSTILSITPSTVTFPTNGTVPSINILFTCSYQTCFYGTVFCDDNNNGIYDSLTESVIPDMPISTTTSDSSGFFTANLGSYYPFTFGHYLSLPTGWLDTNGYYSPVSYILLDSTHLDSNCISNSPVYIPIHCNLTNLDSVCFDGILFEDLNANGVFDTGESTFANVPLIVTIDSATSVIYTDTSGYYSYSGVHIGGANSVDIQVYSIWLNNNNFTTYGPIIISDHNCDSSHTTNIPLSDPNFNSIGSIISVSQNSNLVCDTLTLSLSPEGLDSTVNADFNMYFTGTSLLNQAYTIDVDWGDNTTTTHSGSSTGANQAIVWTPALSHTYAIDSIYNISLTLTKVVNQHSKLKIIHNINVGTCPDYALYLNNVVDCDNDGTIDNSIFVSNQLNNWMYSILYSSIYLYNSTDTIYASFYDHPTQTVHWPDSIPSGMYSLGFQQNVLDDYDLVQTVIADSIMMPNTGQIQTATSVFNCITNQICMNGQVFCDDNGNGVLDPNESTIGGAPISVNGNINFVGPVNTADSTDTAGYYNFPLTVYDTAYFNLQIDQAWLNANGYIISNNNFYFNYPGYTGLDSILDCNIDFNIPVVCNATSSDSICISGQVFCDINSNGILDSNETIIPNVPVHISTLNSPGFFATFSDSSGQFLYHNYHPNIDSVEVSIPSWWLLNNNYNTIPSITTSVLDCSNILNFGVDCNIPQPCDNTWINLFGAGPYYQNWTNTMALNFGNSSYLFPGSVYTISIIIPGGSELDTASFSISNYTLSGDTLSWTQTINGFDSLLINFNVDAGIADSTLHTYQAFISGPNLDCDSTNNQINYTAVVGASYDPNNKLVNLPASIDPAVQETFFYTVNFQNTGTAPAQDVYIEDQLSQYLDWNSLQVISKSHNMYYTLDANGQVTFTFPQIWLPDSTTNEPLSHGYVTYSIQENNNVPINQPIENTAHIFFDLNPAIITNTTINTNTINDLGLTENHPELRLYPNPTSGHLTIASSEQINTVRVYDLSGKIVYKRSTYSPQTYHDLSDLSKGIYQVEIVTNNGTNVSKLILE